MCATCPRTLRALRAHVPYLPYALYVPYVPTRLTCPTCPRAQVYFTDRKIKNTTFNEIKWKFIHWPFQGCWILIWTLIKIFILKIGSKNIKLFYAEDHNNTYKCWRSKEHLQNDKGHAEGKEYIKTPLTLLESFNIGFTKT